MVGKLVMYGVAGFVYQCVYIVQGSCCVYEDEWDISQVEWYIVVIRLFVWMGIQVKVFQFIYDFQGLAEFRVNFIKVGGRFFYQVINSLEGVKGLVISRVDK